MHTCFLNNPFILYIIIIDIYNPSLYLCLWTKGKFACPACDAKIKSRHSKSLGNEVFDEYRHFLSKNHRNITIEKTFQWEERDCIKATENDTSPMKVSI